MSKPAPQVPFDIISCSWPRPVKSVQALWVSEPEWDAPRMPATPQPQWEMLEGELCWTIDWREFFRSGIKYRSRARGGEMRGFHIVFQIRILGDGTLVFWDDDGSIIRRGNRTIHQDCRAHALRKSKITVHAGEVLSIAQWQRNGGWLWGARLAKSPEAPAPDPGDWLQPFLPMVEKRLRRPTGPVLKMYSHGRAPLRTVLALYSMILNGYAPADVMLFGENQWSPRARNLLTRLLPFVRVIRTDQLLEYFKTLGGAPLTAMAEKYWYVLKTFISLLVPPRECCFMDDDVFILDGVGDALSAFRDCDLVFAPDWDWGSDYLSAWESPDRASGHLATGTFNAALYWIRQFGESRDLIERVLNSDPGETRSVWWEQGLIATTYSRRPSHALPTQRYFYPVFDGLPGGVLGYDYERNPCGFASIHFGALAEKPSDATCMKLADQILRGYVQDPGLQ